MDQPTVVNTGPQRDYLTEGFDRIDADLGVLVDCLAEVLTELGEPELARLVPWRETPALPEGEQLPPQLGLVYSIAFQLLNMVEENTAAEVRVRLSQQTRYLAISSSSTSKTRVAPGLIVGGRPWSPYAMSDGHTSLLLPPTFMSCTPSVQHLMTPFSGKVMGSPRLTELSNTVPSVSVP